MNSIESKYRNIENESKASIQEVHDIQIPETQKGLTGGESWETWMKMFTREPGDKVYTYHEFEKVLKTIHPNLCIKYNNVLGFAHFIYLDFYGVPVPICEVGKALDNEIPPESGFIKPTDDMLIKETRQDYAGWKQALFEIKIKFAEYGVKSLWDAGNIGAAKELAAGI